MPILVLNCGSSSIKSAIIEITANDTEPARHLLQARIEDLGPRAMLKMAEAPAESLGALDHARALQFLLERITQNLPAGQHLKAVAHRIVHGGERFTQPALLDDASLSVISQLNSLAPLHNPPALEAIRQARKLLPGLPHIAVFDTAFHATLPTRAREYALPRTLTSEHGIRRYGFHGTSHAHVMQASSRFLRTQPQALRIVSCHLGNGASVCAIEYGRSVETSMGMTPLEGLVMGTRGGDVDPGILLHLQRAAAFEPPALEKLLNSQAGLLGLTGTNDLRQIEQRAAEGDEDCRLALTLYSHRVRKYIGAYAAVMGGMDVLAFTGGIGENSALMRHRIAQRLEFLGLVIDADRNADVRSMPTKSIMDISAQESRAHLLVVRADEEMSIACEAAAMLQRTAAGASLRIPIAISARHAHLSQATLEGLFGPGYQLQCRGALSQTGQYSATDTVALIGPRGRIDHVRLMGPPRTHDQIEISRSDEFTLGIDAPVRISGDINNTPGITLEGPRGRLTIARGVIAARRHIHMTPNDAAPWGLRDHQVVQVRIDSEGRDLIFGDVVIRISPDFKLEMHLDTDEANAAGVRQGDIGVLVL